MRKERNMDPMHAHNIKIFKETVAICQKGEYKVNGKTVQIPAPAQSCYYTGKIKADLSKYPRLSHIEVKVEEDDCLKVARNLAEAGEKVAVLNMASFSKPGGGVWSGCATQEEYIFRCTDAYRTLYAFHDNPRMRLPVRMSRHKYPLGMYDSIYSPSVTVFRDVARNDYALLEKPFQVSLITCAAVKDPKIEYANGKKRLSMRDSVTMKAKVRTILTQALINGNTSLVLGAFGCGAFHNPPEQIAQMFHDELMCEFRDCFRYVVFAIISRDPKNPNLKAFKDVFEMDHNAPFTGVTNDDFMDQPDSSAEGNGYFMYQFAPNRCQR